ncbi:MAG TPA: hypothetical protein VLJ86_08560 [Ramlibacter sp.]|nr:hypothetical protein [Ramlibacter sp.]
MNLPITLATVAGILALGETSSQPMARVVSLKQLEQAYWSCIRVDDQINAAGRMMDEITLNQCSNISKELQVRRFSNDYGRLHEWTLTNRPRFAAAK